MPAACRRKRSSLNSADLLLLDVVRRAALILAHDAQQHHQAELPCCRQAARARSRRARAAQAATRQQPWNSKVARGDGRKGHQGCVSHTILKHSHSPHDLTHLSICYRYCTAGLAWSGRPVPDCEAVRQRVHCCAAQAQCSTKLQGDTYSNTPPPQC